MPTWIPKTCIRLKLKLAAKDSKVLKNITTSNHLWSDNELDISTELSLQLHQSLEMRYWGRITKGSCHSRTNSRTSSLMICLRSNNLWKTLDEDEHITSSSKQSVRWDPPFRDPKAIISHECVTSKLNLPLQNFTIFNFLEWGSLNSQGDKTGNGHWPCWLCVKCPLPFKIFYGKFVIIFSLEAGISAH
jgi:hypothetical protein